MIYRRSQHQNNKELSVTQEEELMDIDPQQGSHAQEADTREPPKDFPKDGAHPEEASKPAVEVSPSTAPSLVEDKKGMNLNPSLSPLSENKDEGLDDRLVADPLINPSPPELVVKNVSSNDDNLETCIENCIENLSAAIPSLNSNHDGCCLDPSSQDQLPQCPYNLRSLVTKPDSLPSVGGIDPSPSLS